MSNTRWRLNAGPQWVLVIGILLILAVVALTLLGYLLPDYNTVHPTVSQTGCIATSTK